MDLELVLLGKMIKTERGKNGKINFKTKTYNFYHFLDRINLEKNEYEALIKALYSKGLIKICNNQITAEKAAIIYLLTKETRRRQ